jgi:MFS family permease
MKFKRLLEMRLTCLHHPSAILSDITTPENRSKALAHVGIAFAICFCIGPPIGAYFASRPLPPSFTASGFELNVYALPAILTLVLLVLETTFLVVALPETRGKRAQVPERTQNEKANGNGVAHANGNGHSVTNGNGKANGNDHSVTNGNGKANGTHRVVAPAAQRLQLLATLRRLHFLFLGLFSGVEFTLTFLTFDCKYLIHLASPLTLLISVLFL